ncbi:MAG: beta-lactamase family protein [Bacillota bacterium]|jgi:CubicO group peptidase (beta-lactamase class C family)|nr:beta-lactamase family protein [Bacillota bacterium]
MIKIKLDEFLEKALVNYDLPGLSIGVWTFESAKRPSEGLLYRGAAGFKDLERGEKLIPEHVFHMASVTKLFVGTSILQLWEQGLLDLDGLLIDYLPWFEMKDERYRQVTIRHLLSHTAGMPDVKDYGWDRPETDERALERYVKSPEVRDGSLLWNPGEGKFAYSNIGYEILGTVIAAVSGISFEAYVKKNIFDPLEMNDSKLLSFERGIYREDGIWDRNLSIPHEKNQEKQIVRGKHYPYNRAHGPSSTLTSNVLDMEKWAEGHLEYRLLKKETYEKAWEKQALVPNNGEHICLSWFRREQNGSVLYGHEGNDDGFRASFWLCPEKALSIMVCSNISGAPVKKINKQVFDLLCQAE